MQRRAQTVKAKLQCFLMPTKSIQDDVAAIGCRRRRDARNPSSAARPISDLSRPARRPTGVPEEGFVQVQMASYVG
jgi:hypothetical protein